VNFDWLLGRRCTDVIASGEHATSFVFGDAAFYVETLWRISQDGELRRLSGDDGQRFGGPAPIDARRDAREWLTSRTVERVIVDVRRGDLSLQFGGGWLLEFITDSGYEAWQLTAPGRNVVAAAGGRVMDLSGDEA
jgi:hypothetical protein